ncbi:MAG: lipopolysaccharide biosynthesis protein [Pikeienuella sp.]
MRKPGKQPPKPRSAYGGAWRNMASNLSIILGERVVFGLVNLAAVAIAARAMPLHDFGVVVMLQAYVRLWGGVMKFQAWKAVLSYGQPMLEAGDRPGFRRLIGFLMRLDIAAIAIAIAIAYATIEPVGRLLSWPPEVVELAPWYTLLLAVMMPSASVGILRILDRFSVLAGQHAVNAVMRLFGAALIYAFGGGAFELALAWGAATLIAGLYMIGVSLTEAKRRGLFPSFRGGWGVGRDYPGIWRFIGVTSVSSTLENTLTQATVLIVGGLLGAGETALFAFARQITDVLTKLGSVMGPIIFPEIARMEARGQRRSLVKLITRTALLTAGFLGAVVLVLIFGGKLLLTMLFGAEAAGAYGFLVASGAAASMLALGFPFEPALLSIGNVRSVLLTISAATLIFGVVIAAAIQPLGLVGVGIALFAHAAFLTASRAAILFAAFRRRED